jgi:CRISPR-associated endonuclease/helicase Cas3
MERDLLNWPGKSAQGDGREHPAVYHMLDVAAVAERLMEPCRFPAALKAAFALLIALHDLGKIGDGFRSMIRSNAKQSLKHWELTEAWLIPGTDLQRWLAAADGYVWWALVGAIAGHHGRPSRLNEGLFPRFRRQTGAEANRDAPAAITGFLALCPMRPWLA